MCTALIAGLWLIPQKACAQDAQGSFQLFYDDLSPYGMWVENPQYGYVWIPDGVSDFSPYSTNGHWVFTDDGWTWFSEYPWGWATFHYGRWDYNDSYGWFWVPDDEWGPAWVSWRRSPGYYGWAPLRPGISITVAFGNDYHERNERWMFVRDRDIDRADLSSHYVDRSKNVTIINNSTVIINTRKDDRRNTAYITGPDRNDVQRAKGSEVRPAVIRESRQPGQRMANGELQIYRPQVQRAAGIGQKPVPSKVTNLNDVKPVSRRNGGNEQQRSPRVNPPAKSQGPELRGVRPPNDNGRKPQPAAVSPQNKTVAPRSRQIKPPENNTRQQQPRRVNPPNRAQPAPTRHFNPSDGKGKKPLPQNDAAPDKKRNTEPQKPKNDKEEKDKGKRDSGQ